MTFYTADLHFGHKNIIEYCNRPFSDVDEMDLFLIEELNACDDEVWIIGDFAFYNKTRVNEILDLIEVPLVLIRGNHDSGGTVKAFLNRGYPVFTKTEMKISGKHTVVSHYPFNDTRYPDRSPVNNGSFLMHGHVHDKWQINGRQLNVGWDAWHKILSQEDVDEAIDSMQ
jgi:calcineurin-like phosphoesterase family protein